jgi:hypothetical protein
VNNKIAPVKILKAGIISVGLMAASFAVTASLHTYLDDANIFSLNLTSLLNLGLLMMLPACLITLSYPAWKGWWKYLATPIPVTAGMYIVLLSLEPINALLVSGVVLLIMIGHMQTSIIMGEMVNNFTFPQMVIKPAVKGYLLSISIVAAAMVLLSPTDTDANITTRLVDLVGTPIRRTLTGNLPMGNIADREIIGDRIEEELENTVKEAIRPYRHLMNVFMAILVFIAMQGLNALVYTLYSLAIIPIFWLFRKTGFIQSDLVQVEKEQLHF